MENSIDIKMLKDQKKFLSTIIYGIITFLLVAIVFVIMSINVLFNLGGSVYNGVTALCVLLLNVILSLVLSVKSISCFMKDKMAAFFMVIKYYCIFAVILLADFLLMLACGISFDIALGVIGSFVLVFFGMIGALIKIKRIKILCSKISKNMYYGTFLGIVFFIDVLFFCAVTGYLSGGYLAVGASIFCFGMFIFFHIASVNIYYRLCVPINAELYKVKNQKDIQDEISYARISFMPVTFNYVACFCCLMLGVFWEEAYIIIFLIILAINIAYTLAGRAINRKNSAQYLAVLSTTAPSPSFQSTTNQFFEKRWHIDLAAETDVCVNLKNEKIGARELFESFKNFCKEKDITIKDEDIKRFFSAIATERIVVANSDNSDNVHKLVKLFSSYFGGNYFKDSENSTWIQERSVVFNFAKADGVSGNVSGNGNLQSEGQVANVDKDYHPSEVIKAVYAANSDNEQITFIEIQIDDFADFNLYFSDFAEAYSCKELNEEICIGSKFKNDDIVKNSCIKIQGNLIVIVNVKNKSAFREVASCLTDKITFLTVGELGGDVDVEKLKRDHVMPYSHFKIAIEEAAEDNFISEVCWRKIDDFSQEVKAISDYKVKNKTLLAMEKCSITWLAMKGSEKEAIDGMIASTLIPSYAESSSVRFSERYKEILDIIGKRFSLKDMKETVRNCEIFAVDEEFVNVDMGE